MYRVTHTHNLRGVHAWWLTSSYTWSRVALVMFHCLSMQRNASQKSPRQPHSPQKHKVKNMRHWSHQVLITLISLCVIFHFKSLWQSDFSFKKIWNKELHGQSKICKRSYEKVHVMFYQILSLNWFVAIQ